MKQPRRPNRLILGLMALGVLAGAVLTANLAQAVSGPGPYYAEPAWDRRLACSTMANCPRFLILTNWDSAAVLDKETGLVWEQSPQTTLATWSQARFACAAKIVGNRKGWRLPAIPELASLIDVITTFPAPKLPPGHPFVTVIAQDYWSATEDKDDSNEANPLDAWFASFGSGDASIAPKGNGGHVWCVRGGNNADQY